MNSKKWRSYAFVPAVTIICTFQHLRDPWSNVVRIVDTQQISCRLPLKKPSFLKLNSDPVLLLLELHPASPSLPWRSMIPHCLTTNTFAVLTQSVHHKQMLRNGMLFISRLIHRNSNSNIYAPCATNSGFHPDRIKPTCIFCSFSFVLISTFLAFSKHVPSFLAGYFPLHYQIWFCTENYIYFKLNE